MLFEKSESGSRSKSEVSVPFLPAPLVSVRTMYRGESRESGDSEIPPTGKL